MQKRWSWLVPDSCTRRYTTSDGARWHTARHTPAGVQLTESLRPLLPVATGPCLRRVSSQTPSRPRRAVLVKQACAAPSHADHVRFAAVTTTPVDWQRAELGWTDEGYVLHVPHSMKARVLQYFERRLIQWLREQGAIGGLQFEAEPLIRYTRGNQAGKTEFGHLELKGEHLFALNATELRDIVNRLAIEAEEHVAEQVRWDQQRVADFLAELRR